MASGKALGAVRLEDAAAWRSPASPASPVYRPARKPWRVNIFPSTRHERLNFGLASRFLSAGGSSRAPRRQEVRVCAEISTPLHTLLIDNYDSYTYNLFQLIAEVNGAPPTVIRNDEVPWPELRERLLCGEFDNVVISPGPGTPSDPEDIGVCIDVLREATGLPILGVCLGMQALALVHGAAVRRAPQPVHGRLSLLEHVGGSGPLPGSTPLPASSDGSSSTTGSCNSGGRLPGSSRLPNYASSNCGFSDNGSSAAMGDDSGAAAVAAQQQQRQHPLFAGLPSGPHSGFAVVRYHSLVVDEASLPGCLEPLAWTCGADRPPPTPSSTQASASLGLLESQRQQQQQESQRQQQREREGEGGTAGEGISAAAEAAAAVSQPCGDGEGVVAGGCGIGPRVLMALGHRQLPHYGVQFHPESVATSFGVELLRNFREITVRYRQQRQHGKQQRSAPAAVGAGRGDGRASPSTSSPARRSSTAVSAAAVAAAAAAAGPPPSSLMTAPSSSPSSLSSAAAEEAAAVSGGHGGDSAQQAPAGSLALEPQPALSVAWRVARGLLPFLGGSEAVFRDMVEGHGVENTFWLDSSSTDRARFSFLGAPGGPLWQRLEYRLPAPPPATVPSAPPPEDMQQQQQPDERQQQQQQQQQDPFLHGGNAARAAAGASLDATAACGSRTVRGCLVVTDSNGRVVDSLQTGFFDYLNARLAAQRLADDAVGGYGSGGGNGADNEAAGTDGLPFAVSGSGVSGNGADVRGEDAVGGSGIGGSSGGEATGTSSGSGVGGSGGGGAEATGSGGTTAGTAALPFAFLGGFVGYLGYELKAEAGGQLAHQAPTPDALMFFADRLVAIDHETGDVYTLALYHADTHTQQQQQQRQPQVQKHEQQQQHRQQQHQLCGSGNGSGVGPVEGQATREAAQAWAGSTLERLQRLARDGGRRHGHAEPSPIISSNGGSSSSIGGSSSSSNGGGSSSNGANGSVRGGGFSSPPRPAAANGVHQQQQHGVGFTLRETQQQYMNNIQECIKALYSGDSYEVCLTTQLQRPGGGAPSSATTTPAASADIAAAGGAAGATAAARGGPDPMLLYRLLRSLNPAPYAAWLHCGPGGPVVACSSPERFLRGGRDGWMEAKPIKGTAARSADPSEDRSLALALASSEKDRAENLMIVDLLRNDLGRVCQQGSVSVPRLMEVESFASVHQLVSTIIGRRRPELSPVDAVRAAFPGGSMTGAPKLRTMRLIDELEGGPRGVYSGAIGYFGLDGAFDLNIVIRSATLSPNGSVSIGAGGAIVVQSDPQAEYEEMLLKAGPLLRAAAMAADHHEQQQQQASPPRLSPLLADQQQQRGPSALLPSPALLPGEQQPLQGLGQGQELGRLMDVREAAAPTVPAPAAASSELGDGAAPGGQGQDLRDLLQQQQEQQQSGGTSAQLQTNKQI